MNLMPLDLDGMRASALPPIFRLRPRYWPAALAYTLRAPMLSAAKRVLPENQSEPVADISNSLFVIGYWRSGTTLLHELLAADPSRVTPTTHQCFNPQSFARLRKGHRATERPMDKMRISSDSPQEDEFALAGLGGRSPYQLWLTPSRLATSWEHGLTFDDKSAEDAWFSVFSDFARRIAGLSGKPLLLKSPPHAFRADLLARRLQHAKFIYIARDPVEVYHSAVNMITKMLEFYALEEWRLVDVENYVIRTRLLLAKRIRGVAAHLTNSRFAYIRFDDLVADPASQIANLLHRLGEPLADSFARRLSRTAEERRSYKRSHDARRLALPDKVVAEWHEINHAWNAGEVT